MGFEGRELDWDDEIEKDSSGQQVIPEGDYNFTVIDYEKGTVEEGQYNPACKVSILNIAIKTPDNEKVYIRHTLYLHSTKESQLSAFFTSIGQKQPGQKARMNWNAVPGSTGRCKIGIRKGKGDYEGKEFNNIKFFYPKETKQYTEGDF